MHTGPRGCGHKPCCAHQQTSAGVAVHSLHIITFRCSYQERQERLVILQEIHPIYTWRDLELHFNAVFFCIKFTRLCVQNKDNSENCIHDLSVSSAGGLPVGRPAAVGGRGGAAHVGRRRPGRAYDAAHRRPGRATLRLLMRCTIREAAGWLHTPGSTLSLPDRSSALKIWALSERLQHEDGGFLNTMATRSSHQICADGCRCAAQETSAILLGWCTAYLAHRPEVGDAQGRLAPGVLAPRDAATSATHCATAAASLCSSSTQGLGSVNVSNVAPLYGMPSVFSNHRVASDVSRWLARRRY